MRRVTTVKFNWQQHGWPNATVNRAALKDELDAFKAAFIWVSKATATRDLAELLKTGAIIAENAASQTRYRLNISIDEPIDEPKSETVNETVSEMVKQLILKKPGLRSAEITKATGKSRATVMRVLSNLQKIHQVEHRGSDKTGGYYCVQ